MRTRRVIAVVLGLLVTATVAGPAAAKPKVKSWSVKVENLTPAGSQPFSPPLFVVHSKKADVWSVGTVASHGVAALAEDASNAVLASALTGAPGFASVSTGAGGPILPGASSTYTVETQGKYNRLTLLTMLVNTNDAFTGLDSVKVKGKGDVFLRMAYDAGSEHNNELAAYIPGPCCGNPFVRDPEGALVGMHPGILGIGDLNPAVYGWTGPVARITITKKG